MQLAEHPDQGLGAVAARLDVQRQPAAATMRALAQSGRHRDALPVEVVADDRGWPLGAQVERTIGVSEMPDSSKKTMAALRRLAFF